MNMIYYSIACAFHIEYSISSQPSRFKIKESKLVDDSGGYLNYSLF